MFSYKRDLFSYKRDILSYKRDQFSYKGHYKRATTETNSATTGVEISKETHDSFVRLFCKDLLVNASHL